MPGDRASRTLVLKDGRRLGFAEYGHPEGRPVFEFHGNPLSRLGGRLLDKAARRLGARIVAVDRPGMGLSQYQPGRRLLDWPKDVAELADALGVERFAVIGNSGGAPFVLAYAYSIPERLERAAALSSPCPPDVPGVTEALSRTERLRWFLLPRTPRWIADPLLGLAARGIRRDPDTFISRMFGWLPEADRAVLARPDVRRCYVASMQEAFRTGPRGVLKDVELTARPWGFQPGDIAIEVQLWHGEADVTVPPVMGRLLARAIPRCQPRFVPKEGHFSLLPNHAEEILGSLLGRSRQGMAHADRHPERTY